MVYKPSPTNTDKLKGTIKRQIRFIGPTNMHKRDQYFPT